MKIVLAIIVYNRFTNLQHWLHCWRQCEQRATMVVIHTGDEVEKYRAECDKHGVKYIHRKNQGFDIGCMQDVFRERLIGFPDYDLLLWCTDDTFPMETDFIKPYLDSMDPGVGVAAMQLSRSVAPHFRTTGFMIAKETANRIKFPADPVTTKGHCYHFEHRGAKETFTNQVRAMGLDCIQIAPIRKSPMWDSAHPNASLRIDRQVEHDQVFNPEKKRGDKVVIICTIYNSYPQIISSLLMQTHKNWNLILIHDGPSSNGMMSYIPDDRRIKYIETEKRLGSWGHFYRQWALKEIGEGRLSDADYIVISNADNYCTPPFLDSLLSGFKKEPNAVASYCEDMIHSYTGWGIINVRLAKGYIDCGGVMVRADVATKVGWRDIKSHSSDFTYFQDIAKVGEFVKVPGCLFVHN